MVYQSVACYQSFDRPLLASKNGKDTHIMSKDNVFALKKPESIINEQIADIFLEVSADTYSDHVNH